MTQTPDFIISRTALGRVDKLICGVMRADWVAGKAVDGELIDINDSFANEARRPISLKAYCNYSRISFPSLFFSPVTL